MHSFNKHGLGAETPRCWGKGVARDTQYPRGLEELPVSGQEGSGGVGKVLGHRLLGNGTDERGERTGLWSRGSEAACTVWKEALMETWEPGVGEQGQERQIWEWQTRSGTYALTLVNVAH